MFKVAPLPGTFMLTSIIGFLISAIYVMTLSPTWGFSFCLVFTFMFVSSIISMTRADAEEELALDALAFHNFSEKKVEYVPRKPRVGHKKSARKRGRKRRKGK